MRSKRCTRYRKSIEFVHAKYCATIHLSLFTHSSVTYNPSFSISSQLRLYTRQQDRVSRVAELDGGGIPGTPDHQLGCDLMGQKTLRVMGCPSHLGYGVVNRSFATCLPRLQGTSSFPPTNKFCFYYSIFDCLSTLVILLACSPKKFMVYTIKIFLFSLFTQNFQVVVEPHVYLSVK